MIKIKKIIAAFFSIIIILTTVSFQEIVVVASEVLNKVVADEFDDAALLGDGVLAKKGGLFNAMHSSDEYYFIDQYGNQTKLTEAIKNNGIDSLYKTTTGINYLLNGVVTVGKEGKVAFMDGSGNLWGNIQYSNISYVNENMFLGTVDGQNWALYKKDGLLIEDFENPLAQNVDENEVPYSEGILENDLQDELRSSYAISMDGTEGTEKSVRPIYTGYSYTHGRLVLLSDTPDGTAIMHIFDADGNKIAKISGVRGYYLSENSDYIGVCDANGNMRVINYDGQEIFTVENTYYLDVDSLQKYGCTVANSGEKKKLVNMQGNIIAEADAVNGYDGQAALVWQDNVAKLISTDGQELINVSDIADGMKSEGYSTFTAGLYYYNQRLLVSVAQAKEGEENYSSLQTKIYGMDQTEQAGQDGYWFDLGGGAHMNEEYVVLTNSDSFKMLMDFQGNTLLSDQSHINLWEKNGGEESVIAQARGNDYNEYKILYKGGIQIQGLLQNQYVNHHCVVWDMAEGYKVVDDFGNIIVGSGQYQQVILNETAPYIIGIKGEMAADVIDFEGQVLNTAPQYANISHTATFSDFNRYSGIYRNGINKTSMLVADNTDTGKVDILKAGSVQQLIDPMEAIPDQIYTGKEIRPEVKVTSNGQPLKEGQDYDIVYQNNIEVGKASITVTGKGVYAGEQTIEFNIVYKKLTAVKNLKAVPAGARKVKLTWDKVQGADGYLVYGQKNGKYGYVGMTRTGITYTDKNALDTDYNFYWVFPYYELENGKKVPGEACQYKYAKGIIPAVGSLKASSVKGGVKLTWRKQNDAQGYLVYGRRAGGKYEYIGMTAKGTTYTDKKASKSEWNYYWVFPYHKGTNDKMIVGETPKYTYGKAK